MTEPSERLIRRALWATVALNAIGVAVFAPPAAMALNATPDLVLSAIFLWWASRRSSTE